MYIDAPASNKSAKLSTPQNLRAQHCRPVKYSIQVHKCKIPKRFRMQLITVYSQHYCNGNTADTSIHCFLLEAVFFCVKYTVHGETTVIKKKSACL